jgi:hypothetical protein
MYYAYSRQSVVISYQLDVMVAIALVIVKTPKGMNGFVGWPINGTAVLLKKTAVV